MSVAALPLDRVQWITESLLDPTGRVFALDGEVYRAIYPEAADRVRKMFEIGLVADLVDRGLLIGTELTDLTLAGAGLVLRHKKVPYLTASAEWCRPLLRDAGLCWIDLNLALLKYGYGTIDAHWGNIGQIDCCRPVWIDFGSIGLLTATKQGIAEYRRFYRNPLQVASRSAPLARFTRGISQTGGLSDYELWCLRCAALPVGGRYVQGVGDRLRRFSSRFTRRTSSSRSEPLDLLRREALLRQEREELETIEFPKLQTTWGEYHPNLLFQPGYQQLYDDPRRAAILRTIEAVRPRRAIDLASNAGFYTFFAARLGAESLGVDFDEAAVERLYQFARSHSADGIKVSCACYDVTRLVYPRAATERKADLVLALALTHHLILGQGCSLSHVANVLANYSTDALLVEFMPNGLGGTKPQPDPLPAFYTLDGFLTALQTRFASVEVVADNKVPSWRVLILCRGVRPPAT